MSEMPPKGTFIARPEITTASRVRAPANVKFATDVRILNLFPTPEIPGSRCPHALILRKSRSIRSDNSAGSIAHQA